MHEKSSAFADVTDSGRNRTLAPEITKPLFLRLQKMTLPKLFRRALQAKQAV